MKSLFTFHYSLFTYIQQRLSLRLGLLIVLVVTVVFTLLFNFLFYRCKRYIQNAAIERATQLLDNTAVRINGIMNETETVTNFMAVTTLRHLTPDSLLAFTRRTVQENAFLTGFAISMEPNFFPEMGRYFSAYSLRYMPSGSTDAVQGDLSLGIPKGDASLDEESPATVPAASPTGSSQSTLQDSITTVREGPFEYFDAVWYKTPRSLGTSCWIDAFDDYNEGTLSSPDILTSYCCPIRSSDGRYIGSITASLTLKWLSQAVSTQKPYPNSSAIMIGRDGTYLVHPDTTKLFHETIFSDPAPEARRDIEVLGKEMLAGHSGMAKTIVDGRNAFIFYRPLERTGWSIAIVCPESDVFARYNRLLIIVWVIIAVGLILLMLFCYLTVRRAVQPLTQLDHAVRQIANGVETGDRGERLQIPRHDSIGRLTNSFILMQQSLDKSVNDIRRVNTELQQQNDELAQAYQLKLETNRRKAVFIKDMYHEIRTPLNIIGGFAQVLTASLHTSTLQNSSLATYNSSLPPEEVEDITARMKESANNISRLASKLSQAATNTSHS